MTATKEQDKGFEREVLDRLTGIEGEQRNSQSEQHNTQTGLHDMKTAVEYLTHNGCTRGAVHASEIKTLKEATRDQWAKINALAKPTRRTLAISAGAASTIAAILVVVVRLVFGPGAIPAELHALATPGAVKPYCAVKAEAGTRSALVRDPEQIPVPLPPVPAVSDASSATNAPQI